MPAFHLHCKCGCFKRKIMKEYKDIICPNCKMHIMLRVNDSNTSGIVKEILDNGFMPRKVERLADIEEIMEERSKEKDEPGIV